jgi:hypothetical protein
MLLGGLWHGAAWTFVTWGGIHGGWLAWEHAREQRRLAQGLPPPPDTLVRRTVERVITFHVVCFAWVFFRAENFGAARDVLWRLVAGWGASRLVTPTVLIAVAGGIGAQFLPSGFPARVQAAFSRLGPALQGAALAGALLIISVLGPQGVAPFIYYQF